MSEVSPNRGGHVGPSNSPTFPTNPVGKAERLLEVLARAGATVGRTPSGELLALGVPPELEAITNALRAELVLATMAAKSLRWLSDEGKPSTRTHRWRTCPECHRSALTKDSSTSCRLTPRCKGKPKPLPQPTPLGELDGEAVVCARPGCTSPAHYLTAWHEPICATDLLHLAQHIAYHEGTATT